MNELSNNDFIKKLNEHLAGGGVIAFPTDTVWGVGALPTAAGAEAIYELKHRPHDKHLIVMSDSVQHLAPHMVGFSARAREIGEKYWPGAITVIGNDDPVFGGVRIPNNDVFRAICARIDGHALATTSANISGEPTLTSAADIHKTFPNIIVIEPSALGPAAANDPKMQPAGLASTVAMVRGDNVQILRAGAVVIED